jgi:hypothetical protein
MRIAIAAAFALAAASSVHAQGPAASPPADYSTAVPISGNWTYSPLAGGSQAVFLNAAAQPQLTISCARATRQVTIAKTATGAAPFLNVWSTSQTRNIPASYNPATGLLSTTIGAYDPLLDAIAFSRGRFAIGASGQPALVLPAWPEVARVVEDCRT